jgi:uncharacterized protein with PIN domain
MNPSEIRFAVDRMLGRLARMLRLLGYDTYYANDMPAAQLLATGRSGERMILTRGETAQRFPHLDKVLSLKSEYPAQQLREVVERLGLDTRSGLWTRCTLCNAHIERVEKAGVEALVEAKIFQLYEDFYRCTGCGHVYWQGSHVDRILRNLAVVLGVEESRSRGVKELKS